MSTSFFHPGRLWIDLRRENPPYERARATGARLGASGFLVGSDRAGRHLPSSIPMILVSGDRRDIGASGADIVLREDDHLQTVIPTRPCGRWIGGHRAREAAAEEGRTPNALPRPPWTVLDLADFPSTEIAELAGCFAAFNTFIAIGDVHIEIAATLLRNGAGIVAVPDVAEQIASALFRNEEPRQMIEYAVTGVSRSRSATVELDVCHRLADDDFVMMDDGTGAAILLSPPARSPAFRLPMLIRDAGVLGTGGGYVRADDLQPGRSLKLFSGSGPSGQAVVGRVEHKESEIANVSLVLVPDDRTITVQLPIRAGVLLAEGMISPCSDLTIGSHFQGVRPA